MPTHTEALYGSGWCYLSTDSSLLRGIGAEILVRFLSTRLYEEAFIIRQPEPGNGTAVSSDSQYHSTAGCEMRL